MIINGDATDQQLLMEEGIRETEAFVSLTDIDEENIMLSLYANHVSNARLITKVNHISFEEVIKEIPIGSVIYPKNITAEHIIRYVRAKQNSLGSNIETMYRMADNRVEALEFIVAENSKITNVPLEQLKTKDNLLICSIQRGRSLITPSGKDCINVGDKVIVVTTHIGLSDINNIISQ
jgi:trk system potassium uptake protein TrkA